MSVRRILAEIEGLRARRHNVYPREVISIAKAVGRSETQRGKHRVFEMPGRPPLPIPDHPRAMAARTVMSILEVLEEDLAGKQDADRGDEQ
jgi:hypothetical protein